MEPEELASENEDDDTGVDESDIESGKKISESDSEFDEGGGEGNGYESDDNDDSSVDNSQNRKALARIKKFNQNNKDASSEASDGTHNSGVEDLTVEVEHKSGGSSSSRSKQKPIHSSIPDVDHRSWNAPNQCDATNINNIMSSKRKRRRKAVDYGAIVNYGGDDDTDEEEKTENSDSD